MKPLSGLVKPGAKYLNFNYTEFAETLYSKSATEFQKTAFAHLAHGSGSIKEVKSSLMLLTTMIPQKTIRNEISAVQQELLLKLEIKSIAMLEYRQYLYFLC